MTESPERQLLRELLDADGDPCGFDESWYMDCTTQKYWIDRIQALLDAPQPEPEYVWRVTARTSYGKPSSFRMAHGDALRAKQVLGDQTVLERAPIGEWEVAS